MKENRFRHFIELNIATVLLSTSGVLGKMISLPPPIAIGLRSMLAVSILFVIAKIANQSLKVHWRRHGLFFLFSGMFFCLHLVTYFQAIRVSTVSVAYISLFTFPVVTTLLEPFFFRVKLSWFNLFTGCLILIGINTLVPSYTLGEEITMGVAWGTLSAVLYAVRNLMNKKYVNTYSSTNILFYQMLVGAIILFPIVLMNIGEQDVSAKDVGVLITLALVTTSMGHNLFVYSLKFFDASTASIITSLQPVYGALLAMWVLGDTIPDRVLIGGGIILVAVVLESIKNQIQAK